MAEEIEIKNVGGANGVASEATLKALVDALNKKDGSGKSGKEAERFNNALKNGTPLVNKNTKSVKENTVNFDKSSKAVATFATKLSGAALGAIGAIAGSIGNLGKEFLNGGTQLGSFTQHLPLIGGVISPLVSIIDDSISSFRQLSSVGATFGNSITEMRSIAASSGLSLAEFGDLVGKNSEAMAALGGSVASGTRNFVGINRELRNSGSFEALTNMGYSVLEVNEGLAEYANQQARLGRLEGKSQKELAAGAANYLTEIDKLARATGKSREEIQRLQAQQEQDAGFRALLGQFKEGTKEFNNFRTSMTLIDSLGGAAATALRDLADGIPQTKEGIALVNAAGPEIADAMQRVARGADPQVLMDALANAGGQLEGFAQGTAQEKAAFIAKMRESNPALAEILDQATALTKMGKRDLKQIEADQAVKDKDTAALLSFETSVREVRSAIQKALIDSGLFGSLAGLMGDLATALAKALPPIVTWLTDFANIAAGTGGFGAAINEKIITPLKDAFIDGITSLWQDNKIIGSIVAALGALFVSSKIVGAISGGFSSLFGGGKAGGAGGAGGGGAGKAGDGVGKFLGNATGGALSGTARGLTAFANPAVILGATNLGLAVVAIGTGIAGAAWILGNTLPTFADGMRSFETLDGAKLESAGSGMVSIGAGFAAFGAGGVAAGIGGIIGGISEGLVSLFGGDDPLTKLQRFSEANIDGEKVRVNAEAMIAFSEAMQSAGVGNAAGIGGIIGGISEGLVGLFGGDDPLTKIQKLGEANINGEKVRVNAEAMIAFGEAMQAAGVGNAAAGAGGLASAISNFFTDDPTEQVKKFGDIAIDVDGVTRNANAMMIMTQGINSLSGSGISSLTIDDDLIEGFERLSRIGSGLTTASSGIAAIGAVTGLDVNITALNTLDRSGIRNYNIELARMVDLLQDMNKELAKDNNGMFSSGNGTNAGSVVSAMAESSSGGNGLNSSILSVLEEIRDVNRRSQRALDDIARNA